MAVIHLERISADSNRKKAAFKLRRWGRRLGAAIMLPVVLGLILLKPTWFGEDD